MKYGLSWMKCRIRKEDNRGMEKQQLYARGEPFSPEINAENIDALDIYGISGHQENTLQAILDKIADKVANKLLEKAEIADWAKQEVKPSYTAAEVGADEYGSAQNALEEAKEYSNGTYQQATGYTDERIAGLLNSAQGTIEALDKISDAMQNNKDVVDALEAAIGGKASDAELQAHISNKTVHITASERAAWNAGKQKLEGIEAGATRVTLTKSLLATEEGTGLDAVVAPVIVGMINSLRDTLTNMINEINGNLGNLSGWIPYSNSFNLEFTNGIGTVDIPGKTVLATSLAVWSIWSPDFNGVVGAANGKIQVNGFQTATPVNGVQWIALAGLIKVQ